MIFIKIKIQADKKPKTDGFSFLWEILIFGLFYFINNFDSG